MTAAIIPISGMARIELPDALTLHEAALEAVASHLHLVIDEGGAVILTPILRPGMQRIAVRDKQARSA